VESSDIDGLSNIANAGRAEEPEPLDKRLLARLIAGALILGIFITFAVQNRESVETEFLGWSFELNKFLLMVMSAVAGVLVWEFAGAYSRRAKKKRSK
jgi:uncharacterized integral membrane protein